ncbi:hypothetical protein [Actinoplanes derwentensis]
MSVSADGDAGHAGGRVGERRGDRVFGCDGDDAVDAVLDEPVDGFQDGPV